LEFERKEKRRGESCESKGEDFGERKRKFLLAKPERRKKNKKMQKKGNAGDFSKKEAIFLEATKKK